MRIFSALILTFAFLSAPHVQAQASDAEDTSSDSAPAASEYQSQVATGIRRSANRDYGRAVEALRAAITMNEEAPDAHYYLASVLRQQGQFESALASFRATAEKAEALGNSLWQARALQGSAETLERIATRPSEGAAAGAAIDSEALQRAIEAWEAVLAFANAHSDTALMTLARSRTTSIHRVIEQDAAYAEIRARIAAREVELAEQRREEESRRRGGR